MGEKEYNPNWVDDPTYRGEPAHYIRHPEPGKEGKWVRPMELDDLYSESDNVLGPVGYPQPAASTDGYVRDPNNPTQFIPKSALKAREGQTARDQAAIARGQQGGQALAAQTTADAQTQGQGGSTMTPNAGAAGAQAPEGVRLENLQAEADNIRGQLGVLSSDEYTQEAMGDELDAIQGIVDKQLGILNAGVAEQEKLANKSVEIAANFETKRNTLVNAQRQAAEEVQRGIDGINTQLLNFEIDPNRAYKSTWQVVGAAIAAAAGAYAQGLSGGKVPNTALAIINKAIDRDIQAQKMELGRLQTAASIKNNVYGRMLQLHGDELRALAETRAAAMTVVKMRMNQLSSTTASKVQAESIRLTTARVDLQQAQHERTAKQNAASTRLTSVVNEMRTLGTGTGAAGKKSVTEKLQAVMPLIDQAILLFDKVNWVGGVMDLTGIARYTGLWAQEGIKAQAYKQSVTLAIKQVVSIFEGSKPSDLDWKVMIQLLPSTWHNKEYGKGTLASFKQLIQAQVSAGKGFAKGDLYKWAVGTGDKKLLGQLQGMNPYDVKGIKEEMGFSEEEYPTR